MQGTIATKQAREFIGNKERKVALSASAGRYLSAFVYFLVSPWKTGGDAGTPLPNLPCETVRRSREHGLDRHRDST